MMKRTTLGLLTSVAMLCSTISLAQLEVVDHEGAAIQRSELKCADTAGKPVPAKVWSACLKAVIAIGPCQVLGQSRKRRLEPARMALPVAPQRARSAMRQFITLTTARSDMVSSYP